MKIGYARLSKGEPGGLTLEIQLDQLKAAGCDRIFSEVISGNARHRPQWEALKEAIGRGEVTEVVAVRMDRLSRSWAAIGELIELFGQPNSPKLTLLNDPSGLDLNSVGGRTVAGVLSSIAAGERERIVERAKAGLAKRAAAGKRHKLAFGLMADPQGFPTIDTRPWLSTISDRRTWTRAEAAVHIWSCWESSPSRYAAKREAFDRFGLVSFQGGSSNVWASNPSLRGALTGGKRDRYGGYPVVKENAFQALIEPSRHKAAVAVFLRERATNSPRRNSKATPLSGKVRCAACGYSMQLHRLLSRPGTAWTFRCRREGCTNHDRRVRYNLLVEATRQHLLQRQDRVLSTLAAGIAPPRIDPQLKRSISEAEAVVSELQRLVAMRPSEAMRRELATAEAELAALRAMDEQRLSTPTISGEEAMRWMAAAMGPLPTQETADGLQVFVPVPAADATAADAITAMLQPEPFEARLAELMPRLVHHLRVDAATGGIEVIDCLS